MKKFMMMIVALAMLAPVLTQTAYADGKYKDATITVAAAATSAYYDFDIYDFANPWLEIERIYAANTAGTGDGATVVWTLRDADKVAATIWTMSSVGAGIISNAMPRTAEISIGQTNCVNWVGRKLRCTVNQTAVAGAASVYKVGVYLK